jgi:hypothetical protein
VHAYAYRYLGYNPQDPNIHFGEILMPCINMFSDLNNHPPNNDMKALIEKSIYAISHLKIIWDIFTKVPFFIFGTSLAENKLPYQPKIKIMFNDPEYTAQTTEEINYYHSKVSRNLEILANPLRDQLPETEREIPPYMYSPTLPTGWFSPLETSRYLSKPLYSKPTRTRDSSMGICSQTGCHHVSIHPKEDMTMKSQLRIRRDLIQFPLKISSLRWWMPIAYQLQG